MSCMAAMSNHAAVIARERLLPLWCDSRDGYAAPVPRQAAATEAPRPADAGTAAAGTDGSADVGAAEGGTGTQRIQAVDRAVALLKSVAASVTPPTVLELARDCGINRST